MGDAAQNAKETTSPGDPSPGPQPNESRQESGGNALQRQVQPATQEPNRVGSGTTAGRKTTASTGYSPPRKKTASSPVDGDVRMASRSSNAYQQRINATNAGEEGRDYVADFLAATAQSNPRGALGVATHPFPQGTYSDVQGFNQQVRCTAMQHNNGVNLWRWHAHTARTLRCTPDLKRLVYAVRSSKPTTRALAMRGSLRTKKKQSIRYSTICCCFARLQMGMLAAQQMAYLQAPQMAFQGMPMAPMAGYPSPGMQGMMQGAYGPPYGYACQGDAHQQHAHEWA